MNSEKLHDCRWLPWYQFWSPTKMRTLASSSLMVMSSSSWFWNRVWEVNYWGFVYGSGKCWHLREQDWRLREYFPGLLLVPDGWHKLLGVNFGQDEVEMQKLEWCVCGHVKSPPTSIRRERWLHADLRFSVSFRWFPRFGALRWNTLVQAYSDSAPKGCSCPEMPLLSQTSCHWVWRVYTWLLEVFHVWSLILLKLVWHLPLHDHKLHTSARPCLALILKYLVLLKAVTQESCDRKG